MRKALLRAGLALGLTTLPALAFAQKALVYCPTADQTGCNAVVTALSSGGYLAVDKGYDGTGGTVDIRTVDLFGYSVFVVPSLADDATTQPYGFLRTADVVEHLKAALIGGLAVWSGTPDQGSANRDSKDQLIRNLAGWAGGSFAQAHGPGLVALLDLSENEGARYDWLRAITPMQLASDVTMTTYDSVRTLTATGAAIRGSLAYQSMAALGFATPSPTPGLRIDALGASGTSTGGQVVLATLPAGNTSTARISTDHLDYSPGQTVTISGSGWAPGETVTITLHEDPLLEQDSSWTTVADGSGNFTNSMFAPDQLDLGTRFVLTGDGGTSGMRAQSTFTDAAKFWAGCLDTNWNTNGNWSTSGTATCTGPGGAATSPTTAAGSADDATITSGRSFYPVIGSGAITPRSITIQTGASVTVSGGTLTPATDAGITNSGTFTVSGTGQLLGDHDFDNNPGATVTFSSSGASTIRKFTVDGTASLSNGSLTLSDDGFFVNAGATLTVSGGTLNTGTNHKGPQGSGTINQSNGTVQVSKFNFSGTYAATGGTIQWTGNGDGASFAGGTYQFFNVLINSGVDPNFDGPPASIKVRGNWENNSTTPGLTGANTTVEFNGSAAQTIGGAQPTNFRNLIINNSSGNVSLNGVDVTVGLSGAGTGTLTFTQGNIVTGTQTVIIAAGGSVTHTSGHVDGNLQKQISANGTVSRTYEVGTGASYTPISVTILTVGSSGTDGTKFLTGSSTASDHPSIGTSTLNSARDANRFWTLTKGGTWTFASYNATFTFINPGDLDAGTTPANFVVRKFNSPSTWTAPPGGSVAAASSTTGTGFTSFSDFAVGEPAGSVPTVSVTSSVNPSVFGQPVTFTATVAYGGAPVAEGSVTFRDGGTDCSTGSVVSGPTTVDVNGQATGTTSGLSVGAHTVRACYSDGPNFGSSSGILVGGQTVNKANTTTTITSDNPDPSVVGQSVTVNYTVVASSPGSGTPTGNVTVSDGTVSCTGTVAAGTCSLTFTSAGAKTLTATYAGDGNFNGGASANEAHQVNKPTTTTTITSDNPDPSVVGQAITVAYTVAVNAPGSGTATGNVTVSDGTISCTATVAAGSCSLTFTSAGPRTLTATYAGDANFQGSTSAGASHTVNAAATSTTISSDSPDPSVVGQAVTVNYSVAVTSPGAGTPTGNVTVSDGTVSCTGTVAAGTCSITLTSAGAKTLTATYAGDGNFAGSTSAGAPHQVNPAATTTAITSDAPDPSVVGQSVTVNFSVTVNSPGAGTPTGNVTVSNGTTSCTGTVAAGTCSITFTTAGPHPLTATYAGDANFTTSTSAAEPHTVNPAATTTAITSDLPDPSMVGQSVTVNYSVTVTSPGAGTPTGNVTVSNGTTSCTGTVAAGTCSLSFPTAGSHPLTATYAGDANFSTSPSAAEPHQVNRAATTTTITSDTPDPSVVGQSVTINYTVTSAGGTPTGNVTVSSGTDSCTGTVATGTCSITFTSAGSHPLTASYAGDANFDVSTSAAAAHQVDPAATTTAITSDAPDPSVVGQSVPVNYSVTVNAPGAGSPTGNVTVSNGTTSCTGTVAAGTCSIAFPTAGSHPLTATYAGDANFTTSTSAVEPHSVNPAATTTSITSDTPDPSLVGGAVTVNYSVAVTSPGAGTPTGNVTVTNGTTSCTGTVAAGTCSLTFNTAGSHPLTATYAGDANFTTSTSAAEPHTVNRAATTTAITSDSPDPSVVGQSVTVNYTVTSTAGTPTGNVTVSNGTTSCTGTVAAGTCSLTFTSAGSHPLTATYAGDANFDVSTSAAAPHTVDPAATTTAITSDTPDPSVVGEAVTVSYTVSVTAPGSGTPTGNVTVSNGTTSCTGTVAGGSCSITFTTAGSHPLTATYAGDADFNGSASAAAPHQVNAAATTTTITSDAPDPSLVGQSVTVNYNVAVNSPGAGTPTGNVTVSNGTTSCTGTVATGTCSLTFNTAGSHPLTATYAGDANFTTSASAAEPHQVNRAATTTTITSDSPDPSVVGQSVTVNYTVTSTAGTPTGNVTVSNGTTSCSGTVAAGTCSLTFTSAGSHPLTASYAGDANFDVSTSAAAPHTVDPAATTTTITSDLPDPSVVGQSVTVNYSVTVNAPGAGTPTGNVTVSNGTTSCIGTVGAGSCSLTFTSAGSHPLTATYAGDADFNGSASATAPHQVNPAATTTTITSDSPDPSAVGQSVTVNYTVAANAPGAGTPTGSVTVSNGTTSCSGTVAAGTCSLTFPTAGSHPLTATYAGDANFSTSTSAAEPHQVDRAATTTAITSDTPDPSVVGQAVTVNYTVTSTAGSPTGNVTVSDGTVSCTGTVAGGSCSLTFTSAGAKTLTATYAGDANFDVSTSAGAAHTVNAAATTTTITSDNPDPSVVGETVMVNYSVTATSPGSGTPTGNVTVSNGTTSCTGTVGAGSCSLTFTSAGSHPLTATYAGDGNFTGSASAAEPHTVNPAATATTITSDTPDPSAVGQSVTVNYSVTVLEPGAGTPTGSVTVSNGTTSCSGTVAAGTCSLTFPTAGSHPLTATYAGDANFSGSASAVEPHSVTAAGTTTTITSDNPDPSVVGQSVTVNYTVTSGAGTPTGNVTVTDGTVSCTGTVASGSCSLTFTSAGAKTLTATYAGDANFGGSTSAGEAHQVNPSATTTTITSDTPDPSVVGQSVTVNYSVTATSPGAGTPTGNVTVSDGTVSCTGTVAAGTCSLTFTSAGAKTLTATYAGNANFSGSTSAAAAHTVNQAGTTTAITSDNPDPSIVGQSVTVNYTVSVTSPGAGTPTGNVTVSDGTVSCTGTVAAGSCSLTFTSPGAKTLTATYAGDLNFSGSTSPGEPHTVNSGDTQAPIVSGTLALPIAINSTGLVTSNVNDQTTGNSNIVSAYFTVDGGAHIAMTATDGNFNSPNENVRGTIPGYNAADVKEICVYGTDAAGNTGHECVLLAIYDPSSGFVTGGGWIMSPAGAYAADPTLTGKANFGFVSKYTNGRTIPTGNTEFQFQTASFNFSSTVYEWLVVSGPLAQYKGSGTINGSGDYGFLLSAVDGGISGGGGTDKFRIKIWNKTTGTVIYDNNNTLSDTATPTTVLGGGSIVIHR